MILAVVVATVVLFAGSMLYARARPFRPPAICPSCAVHMLELPRTLAPAPYDILICPHCANTVTRVHGMNSRFAACPACRQRTLETRVQRLPPTPETPIGVAVDELCHVCGHQDHVVLPPEGVPAGKGKVIPFPRR
ncbi:MAG: hypothetical protein KC656_13755 [Myxococcales bacterium]|nr:hypothetical protein [Myxococcales bacterium]MCB9692788.1 hypothetical protein [Alphaproteobacteria bacterium]